MLGLLPHRKDLPHLLRQFGNLPFDPLGKLCGNQLIVGGGCALLEVVFEGIQVMLLDLMTRNPVDDPVACCAIQVTCKCTR